MRGHSLMEAAYLVHQSGARLRLRVPARRHDGPWLETTAIALRQAPGITAVRSCAATACLTLHLAAQTRSAAAVAQPALRTAGIRLVGSPSPRIAAHHPQCTQPPQATAATGLRADRRTLALALFLLLLARHLVRSGWLVPGLALAWYLWESLPMLRRAMRGSSERTRS